MWSGVVFLTLKWSLVNEHPVVVFKYSKEIKRYTFIGCYKIIVEESPFDGGSDKKSQINLLTETMT